MENPVLPDRQPNNNYDSFIETLQEWQITPPGSDPYIGTWAGGMLDSLVQDDLRSVLHDLLTFSQYQNRFVDSEYTANLAFRAIQKRIQELPPGEVRYPRDFTRDIWHDAVTSILRDQQGLADFRFIMLTRSIQSNVPGRYRGPWYAAQLLECGDGETISFLDVGCGGNLGLKQMARLDEFPFEAVDVILPFRKSARREADLIRSEQLSRRLSEFNAGSVALRGCVATDIFDYRTDPEILPWVISNTLRPLEQLDETKTARLRALANIDDVEGVTFLPGDFAADPDNHSERHIKFPDIPRDQQFDIGLFLTVWYQTPPDEQQIMLDNMLRFMKPDGLVIVQDKAMPSPDNPMELQFFHDFDNYHYHTLVWDLAQPDLGFQELFLWSNGRCDQLVFGDSALVARAFEKLIETR